MTNSRKRAFSLIEVLIAIAIIGLAASLVYPVVQGSKNRSAYELSVVDLGSVAKAMEHHYLEKGMFPVFKAWEDVAAEASPLREYLNDIPAKDHFNRPYVVSESTENSYIFEGLAINGKAAKEYPDYNYSTGGKFKKGKKK